MNIALILMPSYNPDKPPLSLAYLKSYNLSDQVNIKCLDFNIDLYARANNQDKLLWDTGSSELWTNENNFSHLTIINNDLIDEWISKIMNTDPKIIGFSTYSTNMWLTIKIGKRIREISKDVLILLGGPEVFMNRINFDIGHLKFADAIILGEGEEAIKNIVKSVNENGFIVPMSGVLLKIGNCFVGEEKVELINNLNEIPFPNYDDFELSRYKEPGQLPMVFSRGCVNKCAFCFETVFWQKFRRRSADNIINEIDYLLEKYNRNIFNFSFNDSLINGDMELLGEFCDVVINKKMNIGWWGMARIDKRMDREFIKKMIKAGCRSLAYGIESGSQKVLDLMRKHYKVIDIEKCIEETFKAGIKPGISLLIGFPGESEDDFNETCEFVKKIGKYISYVNISSLGIIPGTSIDNDRYKLGITKKDATDWTDLDGNNISVRVDRVNRLRQVVNDHVGKSVSFKP